MKIEEMKQCLAEINLAEQRITKFVDRLGLINSGVVITDTRKNTCLFFQGEDAEIVKNGILVALASDYCVLNGLYRKLCVKEEVKLHSAVASFMSEIATVCVKFGFTVDREDY